MRRQAFLDVQRPILGPFGLSRMFEGLSGPFGPIQDPTQGGRRRIYEALWSYPVTPGLHRWVGGILKHGHMNFKKKLSL